MRLLLFLAVSLGAASAAAGQTGGTSADSAIYAFTGVTLIDGTGAPARPGTTILVTGERITDVFPDGSRPIPSSAHTPNVTGRFVIPGLIDTHVHLATDPSNDDSLALTERKLKSALLGGVTTVRDMAGDARMLGFLARAAAVRDIVSPSIYYAALFAGPNFFTDPRVRATSAGVPLGQAPWARSVTAGTDWRQVIAEARGTGATGIKLYADFTADVLPPLVAEAHRQGFKVWAHAALFPAKPSDVVAAGVDVISHAPLLGVEVDTAHSDFRLRSRLDYSKLPLDAPALDRLLHEMAARGTIFEPTLYVYFVRDSNSTALRWAASITRRANQAGVAISAGTDMMVGNEADILDSPPHLQEELGLLVNRAGLTPSQALVAATSIAARAIGVDSLVGTVTPGKLADLVVLTADPLANIENTRKIELVMARGVVYRPDR